MLEVIGAFGASLKMKLATILVTSGMMIALGGLTTVAFTGLAVYGFQVSNQRPTIPEIEEHIDNDDKRLDGIDKTIDKRFDTLEEDRKERKKDSDARYKDLSDSIHSLQEYQSYVSGGGAIIAFLLTIGVIKLNSAEKKISQNHIPAKIPVTLTEDDIKMLAQYLRSQGPAKR